MSYLLDTNIISETIKREPNANLIKWLRSIGVENFYLSVITLGEVRKGAEKLTDFTRKQKITQWLEFDLPKMFLGRIVVIDLEVADKWGYILSKVQVPAVDALIAASALVNNLKLVTRNVKDFNNIPGLEIINPWEF